MATEKNTKEAAPKVDVSRPDVRKKEMVEEFKKEEKVSVYLAPLYRPYFGNVMTISINGVSIYLPVDGKTYEIPKTYASVVEERRQAIDRLLMKQGIMASVQDNVESTPGELELL